MEIVELFGKGGAVMWLLLACSVAVAVIGIERLRFYRHAAEGGEKFLAALAERIRRQPAEEIIGFCATTFIGKIAAAGIRAALNGENIEAAMNIAYDEAAMKLRARLNYLSTIVTLAPLLGLLGTISGMIDAFNIFSLQAGQPLAITSGIGEALIATASGLCVAIFALIVHTILAQLLDENLTRLDKTINIVLAAGDHHATP